MTGEAVSTLRRWKVAAVAAGLGVLLIAGDFVLWWVVTGQIIAAIPAVEASAAQAGWRLQSGALRRSGWPWAATVILPDVAVTRTLGESSLHWTTSNLVLTIAPSAPNVLRVEPKGSQTAGDDHGSSVTIQMTDAFLLIRLKGDGPVAFHASDVLVKLPGQEAVRTGTADVSFDERSLTGTAAALTPIPPLAAPFDGGAQFSIDLTWSPAFAPAASPTLSAAAWQAAGGSVTIRLASVNWGPVTIAANGSGGLDDRLQPKAQGTIHAAGLAEVVDAGVRAGLIGLSSASAAKAVLLLMTLAAGGGPSVLPVTLADHTLTVAQFPLLTLPLFDWGNR